MIGLCLLLGSLVGQALPKPECGLHCLFVSLRHLGLAVKFDDIRKQLGPVPLTTEGYSLGQLAEVFEKKGLHTLLVETNVDNLLRREHPFSVIAHVDNKTHFVSVLDIDPSTESVRVFDSKTIKLDSGIAWIDRIALESRWSGTALLVSPEPLVPEEDLPWTTTMWARQVAAILLPVALCLSGGAAIVWLRQRRRNW